MTGLSSRAKELRVSATTMVLPMQPRTRPPIMASVIQSQRDERFFGCCGGLESGRGEPPYCGGPSGGCRYCGRGCRPHCGGDSYSGGCSSCDNDRWLNGGGCCPEDDDSGWFGSWSICNSSWFGCCPLSQNGSLARDTLVMAKGICHSACYPRRCFCSA